MQLKSAAILLSVLVGFNVNAQGLSSNDQEALQKTLELLRDPSKRNQAISGDQSATKADSYAKEVGGKHSEEIYALAAKVFEKMAIKYNGDVKKMTEVMERAQRDPAGFANSEFTQEELNALRALSLKLQPSTDGNR